MGSSTTTDAPPRYALRHNGRLVARVGRLYESDGTVYATYRIVDDSASNAAGERLRDYIEMSIGVYADGDADMDAEFGRFPATIADCWELVDEVASLTRSLDAAPAFVDEVEACWIWVGEWHRAAVARGAGER